MSWLERLDAYVGGSADDEDKLEEELFEAAANGDVEVAFFDRTVESIGWLAERGVFGDGPSRAMIDGLRAEGVVVHEVEGGSPGTIPIVKFPEATQVFALHLSIDVRAYEEVEVEMENEDGTKVKTFRGVECDPKDGSIYAVCQPSLAAMAFCTKKRIGHITGIKDGKREHIATYVTIPSQ